MEWYIKVSDEDIINHIAKDNINANPSDYDHEVTVNKLIDKYNRYEYKYSGGQLVKLTKEEIENHSLALDQNEINKIHKAKKLIADKIHLKELKKQSNVSNEWKQKIDNMIAVLDVRLTELIGI